MFSNKFMLRISTLNITEFSTKSLAVLPGTKRQMLLSSKQPHTMKYFWKHFPEKLYSTFKTKEKKMEVTFWCAKYITIWVSHKILISSHVETSTIRDTSKSKAMLWQKNISFNTYSQYLLNHIMWCLYNELTVGVEIFL